MKHFIFQNDITKEHLIVDANNVTEALYIMTVNPVLIDHTYIGCTETVITKFTNANKNVEDKIEQFARLCRITELAKEVAKLPTLKRDSNFDSTDTPDKLQAFAVDPDYIDKIFYQRYILCVGVTCNNNKYRDYFDIYIKNDSQYIVNGYLDEIKALDLVNEYYEGKDYTVDSVITRNYEGNYTSSSYDTSYYVASSATVLATRSESYDVTAVTKLHATKCDKFEAVSDKAKK